MITPTKHRVIVQRDSSPTETESGLAIPKEALRKETTGTIIAVGPKADEQLLVGYRVMFGAHDGTEIKPQYTDGLEDCLLIPDSQITCVIG